MQLLKDSDAKAHKHVIRLLLDVLPLRKLNEDQSCY